jgi:hypothetical protein
MSKMWMQLSRLRVYEYRAAMRIGIGILLALGFIYSSFSCGRSSSTTTPSPQRGSIAVDTDRFPHGVHTGNAAEIRNYKGRGLGCADCHDASQVKTGGSTRPGMQSHAPCDDCHKAEFYKPPGPLCLVCHTAVDPKAPRGAALSQVSASPLQPYPERGRQQVLASVFSHQQHLDREGMDGAVGFHLDCADCHSRNDKGEPQVPQHAACIRCHEKEPRPTTKLPMTNCNGCHLSRNVELARGRRFITGDLKFDHGTHQKDRSGAAVPCSACHSDIASSQSREDAGVPAMERCAQCHEDSQKSPDRVRMGQCSVCHAGMSSGTPPTNHGVTGAVPSSHTLEFRKSHGASAAAPDSNCRFCHTELSGAKEDSCFQCHQVMKPRDHSLMWRDDHGKSAQANNDRCAACHTADTCVACHSVPPRSHSPLGEFKLGGHAQAARFGMSTCLACHTYEDTCVKCHRGAR